MQKWSNKVYSGSQVLFSLSEGVFLHLFDSLYCDNERHFRLKDGHVLGAIHGCVRGDLRHFLVNFTGNRVVPFNWISNTGFIENIFAWLKEGEEQRQEGGDRVQGGEDRAGQFANGELVVVVEAGASMKRMSLFDWIKYYLNIIFWKYKTERWTTGTYFMHLT